MVCRVYRANSFTKALLQGILSKSLFVEGNQSSLRALFILIPQAGKCTNVSSEAEVRSCLSNLQAAEMICPQLLCAGTFGIIPRAAGLWQARDHTVTNTGVQPTVHTLVLDVRVVFNGVWLISWDQRAQCHQGEKGVKRGSVDIKILFTRNCAAVLTGQGVMSIK